MTQYLCSCTRLIYSRVVAHPKIFWHKLQMQIPCLEPCHLFDSVWMTLMPLLTSTLCASYSHCIPQASLNSRLRIKVHIPYESLQSLVMRLQQFQQASDLLRRTSRFVNLMRRLWVQMKEIQAQKSSDKGVVDDSVSAAIRLGKDSRWQRTCLRPLWP